jgi:hypothetical protein
MLRWRRNWRSAATQPVRRNWNASPPTAAGWPSTRRATFTEALQAVWFLFVLLQIESNASSFSPGRFDQYMLPYLEAGPGWGG